LGNSNSYATTAVTQGALIIGAANALPPGANLIMGNTSNVCTLSLSSSPTTAFDQTVSGISLLSGATAVNSQITSAASGTPVTFTVTNSTANSYAGLITGN